MSKITKKRLERMESIILGGAFLMQQMYTRYRRDLSDGMDQQIREFLNDAKQVRIAQEVRIKAEQAAKEGQQ
jgi:hypothetical protein